MAKEYVTNNDKTLHWTVSLYVHQDTIKLDVGVPPTPEAYRSVQCSCTDSLNLRNAIDPLFNDISDRARLDKVDDIILASNYIKKKLLIRVPSKIIWETEGVKFTAEPPGLGVSRPLILTCFWYSHPNGAISYHLSFSYYYRRHTPAEFYFISLLQKVCAPKEFYNGNTPVDSCGLTGNGKTNVFPLDRVRIGKQTFWKFVKKRFETDYLELLTKLSIVFKTKKPDKIPIFENTIKFAPFIEVPGLIMPVNRYMFFFLDEKLFSRLMPPIPDGWDKRPSRSDMCQEACYIPFQQKIAALLVQAKGNVRMNAAYWDWVSADKARYPEVVSDAFHALRKKFPALEDRARSDCLQFLFMSGFNQNIIDFMNQDASEVQDSLDPIYPTNQIQEGESFFVRFANPRALITYVRRSRSLETGNDFIGTCPYAFLIHATSFHNELLARDYERKTFSLVDKVESLRLQRRLQKSAEAFYEFRLSETLAYRRYKYRNIFRYDTEADVFKALEQRRGTDRLDGYLEELVSNSEKQTRDMEARISKKDDRQVSLGLGMLGAFGFFQLAFDWSEAISSFDRLVETKYTFFYVLDAAQRNPDSILLWTLYASGLFSLVFLVSLMIYYSSRLFRPIRDSFLAFPAIIYEVVSFSFRKIKALGRRK